MKTMNLSFFLFPMLCVLFSCSNLDDGINYSCNKEIDSWVKSNIDNVQQMSRTEFLNYNEMSQRAIFAAMSPEQRYDLWIAKLNDLLILDWKKNEEDHLNELFVFVKENKTLFNEKTNEDITDKLTLFMYKWKEYAKDELGWDDITLYNIYGTLNNPSQTREEGITRLMIQKTNKVVAEIPLTKSAGELVQPADPNADCSCNSVEDFCGNNNSSSLGGSLTFKCSGSCKNPTQKGCGWFLQASCSGGCNGYFTSSIH